MHTAQRRQRRLAVPVVLHRGALGARPDQAQRHIGAIEMVAGIARKADAAIEPAGIGAVARVGHSELEVLRREQALAEEHAVAQLTFEPVRQEHGVGHRAQRRIGGVSGRLLARGEGEAQALRVVQIVMIDEGVILLDQIARRGVVTGGAGRAHVSAGVRQSGDREDAERRDERGRKTARSHQTATAAEGASGLSAIENCGA